MNKKEFIEKWKIGIQKITPFQMVKINIMGAIIILFGVLAGLCSTFYLKVWWLFTILIGSLFLTSVNLISLIQKYIVLKELNKNIEEVEDVYQEQESPGT